jgi:hypothetical protein
MNKPELDIDEKIMKEVGVVDWHRVSAYDASRFGLSVGFFRDAVAAWKQCRVAWGCAAGGAISSAVLALACLVAGAGPAFALALVLTHQAIRTMVLWWKAHQAQKVVAETEKQAVDSAQQLAQTYPPVAAVRAA